MIQELGLTPSTIVIVLVVLGLAVLAVRRMVKRGMCDCSDHCDGCSKKKETNGSSCSCSAIDDMVARMEKDANERLGHQH